MKKTDFLSQPKQRHHKASKFALYFSNCLRQLDSAALRQCYFICIFSTYKREEFSWLIAHRKHTEFTQPISCFCSNHLGVLHLSNKVNKVFSVKGRQGHVCTWLKNALSSGRFWKIKYQQLNLSDEFSKWFCHILEHWIDGRIFPLLQQYKYVLSDII